MFIVFFIQKIYGVKFILWNYIVFIDSDLSFSVSTCPIRKSIKKTRNVVYKLNNNNSNILTN